MNEKTKVFVFERKEVFLILLCVVMISLMSFSFGIKMGKSYSFYQAGLKDIDKKSMEEKSLEMKSFDEEVVEKVMLETQKNKGTHTQTAVTSPSTSASASASAPVTDDKEKNYRKLEEEFNKLDQELNQTMATTTKTTEEARVRAGGPRPADTKIAEMRATDLMDNLAPDMSSSQQALATSVNEANAYKGKYTIQLGSYQLENDAIKFADGFKVRGYSPIIQEVHIEGKGQWFRVSLGTFQSVASAKEYILKEESLFQGQDYVITEFQ